MAVSKELLARYKELKAQGINVTLSELKAQMEAEENSVNNYSSEPQISETPKPTGFSALSSCTTQVTNTQSPEPVPTQVSQTENTSWSTSYYSQPEESYEKPVETYTSSFEATIRYNQIQSKAIHIQIQYIMNLFNLYKLNLQLSQKLSLKIFHKIQILTQMHIITTLMQTFRGNRLINKIHYQQMKKNLNTQEMFHLNRQVHFLDLQL